MPDHSRLRMPVMALAVFTMLAALWAGWIRLGWGWPALQPGLIQSHGPLMVSGFLGTLIALERAVALQKRWMYIGPVFSALGGLALVLGVPGLPGPALITLASLLFVAVLAVMIKRHPALYTCLMGAGALAWAISNLLWLAGWPIYRIVFWWAGFLILTIAGERLELGRLLRLSKQTERAFLAATGLFLLGLILSVPAFQLGARVTGLGLLALAAWLLRSDIARLTIRQNGLPRFAAVCLLAGYLWLGIGGLLSVFYGGTAAGPIYDAILHSIFLGFVISMIFGHAPIIFPAVLRLPITYSPVFYLHLFLLHSSLLVRVGADLAGNQPLRLFGGLFNGIAILVFLCATVHAVARSTRNASLVGKPARIT